MQSIAIASKPQTHTHTYDTEACRTRIDRPGEQATRGRKQKQQAAGTNHNQTAVRVRTCFFLFQNQTHSRANS